MKKIFFLSFICALTILSCKNKGDAKANTIVGKWKIVVMNIDMSETDKKDMMASTQLEFAADNKFIVHRKDDKREGTYKLEGKTLTTITGADHTEKFTIDWAADTLLMTNKEGVVKLKKD